MKYFINKADLIVNNQIRFDRIFDMEEDRRIVDISDLDWKMIAFDDPEWNYMLNRMEYLIDLAVAYRDTANNVYKTKVIQLIEHWISNNIEHLSFHRTIDTGMRLVSWAEALEIIGEDVSENVQNAMFIQSQYMMDNYRLKDDLSNWGIFQTIGSLINEQYLSDELRIFWQEKLKVQLQLQINNEGFHWEHSIMYHNEVLLYLCRLERKTTKYELLEYIDKMAIATNALMKPNLKQVMQNDSDDSSVVGLLQFASELTKNNNYLFNGKDQISHIYCNCRESDSSDQMNKCEIYPNSCLVVKRDNSTYISMHNHPYGSSHSHFMPCHINFWNQEDILVDPGRYTYVDCEERIKLKSLKSHNSPYIKEKLQEQISNSWDSLSNVQRETIKGKQFSAFTYFYGSYTIGDLLIKRRTFVFNETLLILDQYPNQHECTKCVNLTFGPNIKIEDGILSTGHCLQHNYEKIKSGVTLHSPHYNQQQTTEQLSFTDTRSESLKYIALLETGASLATDIAQKYNTYDLKIKTEHIKICVLKEDITIGSKITEIEGFKIYGKVVVINMISKEVITVEI